MKDKLATTIANIVSKRPKDKRIKAVTVTLNMKNILDIEGSVEV